MNPTLHLNSAGQKEKAENLTITQYSTGTPLTVYADNRYDVVFAVFTQPNGAKSKQIHLSYKGKDEDLNKHKYETEIPYSATCFAMATPTAKLGVSVHLWLYRDSLADFEAVAVADIIVSKGADTDQYDPAYNGNDLDNLWRAVDKNAEDNYDNGQEIAKIKTGETVVPKAAADASGKTIASQEYVAQFAYSKAEIDNTRYTKAEVDAMAGALQSGLESEDAKIDREIAKLEAADASNLATAKAYTDTRESATRSDLASVIATKADTSTITAELTKIKADMGGKAANFVFADPEAVGLVSAELTNQVEIANTYTDMNGLKLSDAKIGDDIRFIKEDVRDYWVYGKRAGILQLSILETEKYDASEIEAAEAVRVQHEADRVTSETQRKADERDRQQRYQEMGILKNELTAKNIALGPVYDMFHDAAFITESAFNALTEEQKQGRVFFIKIGE